MKIESGKSYRRRDGVVRGPAIQADDPNYPFRVGREPYRADGFYFAPDGNGRQPTHPMDLIEEEK